MLFIMGCIHIYAQCPHEACLVLVILFAHACLQCKRRWTNQRKRAKKARLLLKKTKEVLEENRELNAPGPTAPPLSLPIKHVLEVWVNGILLWTIQNRLLCLSYLPRHCLQPCRCKQYVAITALACAYGATCTKRLHYAWEFTLAF